MVEREPFEKAMRDATVGGNKPRLLLGNGFSQAYSQDMFSWNSIYERAELTERLRRCFDAIGSRDFEVTIKSLQDSAKLHRIYQQPNEEVANLMQEDADSLKDVLAETIAHNHPINVSEIEDAKFHSCIRFLSKFESVYTLNYDLLLYWTYMWAMKAENETLRKTGAIPSLTCDDGFRNAPGEDFVIWEGDYKQCVYFLHGALHLILGTEEIKKITWNRTQISLIDQLKDSMSKEYYPIFVAEGESVRKKGKIMRNGYLSKCFRSFQKLNGNLVVFGASLSERDRYLVDAIAISSTVSHLFVGLFGDVESPGNQEVIATLDEAVDKRNAVLAKNPRKRISLSVSYFDSGSVNPWTSF